MLGMYVYTNSNHIVGEECAVAISPDAVSHCDIPGSVSCPPGHRTVDICGTLYYATETRSDENFVYAKSIVRKIAGSTNINLNLTEGYITPLSCAFVNDFGVDDENDDVRVVDGKITVKQPFTETKIGPLIITVTTRPHANLNLKRFADDLESSDRVRITDALEVKSEIGLRNVLVDYTVFKKTITHELLVTSPVSFRFGPNTEHHIEGYVVGNSRSARSENVYRWDVVHARQVHKLGGNWKSNTTRELYSARSVETPLVVYEDPDANSSTDVTEADLYLYNSAAKYYAGYRLRFPLTQVATIPTKGHVKIDLKQLFGNEIPIETTSKNLELVGSYLQGTVIEAENLEVRYRFCTLPLRIVVERNFENLTETTYVAYCTDGAAMTTVSLFTSRVLTLTLNDTGDGVTISKDVIKVSNLKVPRTIIAEDAEIKLNIVLQPLSYRIGIVAIVVPMGMHVVLPQLRLETSMAPMKYMIGGEGPCLVKSTTGLTRLPAAASHLDEVPDSVDGTEYIDITEGFSVKLTQELISSLVINRLFAMMYAPDDDDFKVQDQITIIPAEILPSTLELTIHTVVPGDVRFEGQCVVNGRYYTSYEFSSGQTNIYVYTGSKFQLYTVTLVQYVPPLTGDIQSVYAVGLRKFGDLYIYKPTLDSGIDSTGLSLLTTFNYNFNIPAKFTYPSIESAEVEVKDSVLVQRLPYIVTSDDLHYADDCEFVNGSIYTLSSLPTLDICGISAVGQSMLSGSALDVSVNTVYFCKQLFRYNVTCKLGVPVGIHGFDDIETDVLTIRDNILTVFSTDVYMMFNNLTQLVIEIDPTPKAVEYTTYGCYVNPETGEVSDTEYTGSYYTVTTTSLSLELAFRMLDAYKTPITQGEIIRTKGLYIMVDNALWNRALNEPIGIQLSDGSIYTLPNYTNHLKRFPNGRFVATDNVVWSTTKSAGSHTLRSISGISYIYSITNNTVYGLFITNFDIKTSRTGNGQWYRVTDILVPVISISLPGKYICLPEMYSWTTS